MGFLFTLPAVLYFGVVYFYPFLTSVLMSFYDWSPLGTKFIGINAYQAVLSDPTFWHTVKNSLYLMCLSVPGTVILALIFAVFLYSIKSDRSRHTFNIIYLLPYVVSLIAASLIWQWLFDPNYGVLNYFLGLVGLPKLGWLTSESQVIPSISLVNIWLRLGFNVTILLSGLQTIPTDFYEAAMIDGASNTKIFFKITLPLLNPQIILVTINELIFAAKSFDQIYATTQGGPANASRVIMLYLYDTAFKWFHFGKASVVAVFFCLFLLLISIMQWLFLRKKVEY